MSREEYLEEFQKNEYDFEMFSKQGNEKVKEIILETLNKMFYDEKINRRKLLNFISHKINEAYSDKSKAFREIRDTEPEVHIAEQVNKTMKETGVGFKVNRFDW